MKFVASVLLAVMLLMSPNAKSADATKSASEASALSAQTYQSVMILYRENEDGGMKMLCTATVYKKTAKGYRLVSAAHCVQGDTEQQQREIQFFVTSDSKDAKNFIAAKLIEAGDKAVGDDFSIFEIETKNSLAMMPLGDDVSVKAGDDVIDIASPFGLGKQFFRGYVSSPHVDRPPLDAGEVQWNDVMLVMIGGGPGSSGSAIVSVDQKAIIGFLVGGIPGANIGAIVVPVDKFKKFETAVDAGKYKKTHKPNEEKLGFSIPKDRRIEFAVLLFIIKFFV